MPRGDLNSLTFFGYETVDESLVLHFSEVIVKVMKLNILKYNIFNVITRIHITDVKNVA